MKKLEISIAEVAESPPVECDWDTSMYHLPPMAPVGDPLLNRAGLWKRRNHLL